ncbi:DNA-binding protein [Rhodococcus sp. BGS-1C]|uniref:DNA-binding protein n=1 Tax=Rhodococcus sp. BGS-1C TaxID=2100132 RepID=UPI003DA17F8C
MDQDAINRLGVSTDLVTAAAALGIGKSSAYTAAANGTFPCRVIRVGSRYVVPTAGLKAVLGLSGSVGAA